MPPDAQLARELQDLMVTIPSWVTEKQVPVRELRDVVQFQLSTAQVAHATDILRLHCSGVGAERILLPRSIRRKRTAPECVELNTPSSNEASQTRGSSGRQVRMRLHNVL